MAFQVPKLYSFLICSQGFQQTPEIRAAGCECYVRKRDCMTAALEKLSQIDFPDHHGHAYIVIQTQRRGKIVRLRSYCPYLVDCKHSVTFTRDIPSGVPLW